MNDYLTLLVSFPLTITRERLSAICGTVAMADHEIAHTIAAEVTCFDDDSAPLVIWQDDVAVRALGLSAEEYVGAEECACEAYDAELARLFASMAPVAKCSTAELFRRIGAGLAGAA
jgi:hypothetical protein